MLVLVEALTRTERFLRERGIDVPRLEAELLLAHALGLSRIQLYLAHDRPLNEAEVERLRALVARRGKREPLAYIVGTRAFHAIELSVEPGVLIPRADTETLVEAALEWMPAGEQPVFIADIGCGSGCIGLSIAQARPPARIYAVDRSTVALRVARTNRDRLGLQQRVAILEGDLLGGIPAERPIDWVLSNPPYIPTGDIPGLMPEVASFEPREALDGGPDGLDVYRRLLPDAARRARCGVLVEIGHGQAPAVLDLFRQAGLTDITTWNDLSGVCRVVGGRTVGVPSKT